MKLINFDHEALRTRLTSSMVNSFISYVACVTFFAKASYRFQTSGGSDYLNRPGRKELPNDIVVGPRKRRTKIQLHKEVVKDILRYCYYINGHPNMDSLTPTKREPTIQPPNV